MSSGLRAGRRRAYGGVTVIFAASALVLAACGSSGNSAASGTPSPASASPSGATNSPLTTLYQKAKSGGTVTFYEPLAVGAMQPVVTAFEHAYPGVKVKVSDVKPPQIFNDVQVQEAAHNVQIGVGAMADLQVYNALQHNVAQTVDWAQYGVPSADIFDGTIVRYQQDAKVIIYNKSLVPKSAVPTSWSDLLNQRWKGKIAVDGRGTFLEEYFSDPQLGTAKGISYAKQLLSNKPLLESNNSSVLPLVASGQVLVGDDDANDVINGLKKGDPVGIAPVQPVDVSNTWLYVPKGAPNMAGDELLVAWLMSSAGQMIQAQAGSGLLTSCSNSSTSAQTALLCGSHITQWETLPATMQSYKTVVPDFFTPVQKVFGTYSGK